MRILCPRAMWKTNSMCAEMSGPKKSWVRATADPELPKRRSADYRKPVILIYSPDMNFCFSLSSFFQDRYDVITTTDPEFLGSLASIRTARLVMIDEEPSPGMIDRVRDLRRVNHDLPVIMLYVYGPRGGDLDKAVREHVNAVLYKPLSVNEISRSIEELIGA